MKVVDPIKRIVNAAFFCLALAACNSGSQTPTNGSANYPQQPSNGKAVFVKNIYNGNSKHAINTLSAYDRGSNSSYLGYIDKINHSMQLEICQADKCNPLALPTNAAVDEMGIAYTNSGLYLAYNLGNQINLARFDGNNWQALDTSSLNKQQQRPQDLKLDSDDNSNLYLYSNYQNSTSYDLVVINSITQTMQQLLPNLLNLKNIVMTPCGSSECIALIRNASSQFSLQAYAYNPNQAINANNPALLKDSNKLLRNLANRQVDLTYSKPSKLLVISNIDQSANKLNNPNGDTGRGSSSIWAYNATAAQE